MAGTVSNLLPAPKMTTGLGSSFFGAPVGSNAGVLKAPAISSPAPSLYTQANPSTPYVAPQTASQPAVKGLISPTPSAPVQNNTAQSSTPSLANPNAGLQTQGLTGGPAIPTAVNQYENPGNSLYGQIATGLANTASTGSPQAQQAIGATQTAAQGTYNQSAPQEQQAYDAAQQYNKQLQDLRSGYANEYSNIQGSGIPLEFQQGRAQVLQNQYANLASGYGAALQGESALAGIGQTGMGQGITGLGNAAGAANTAQGQTLSGLGQAGQLAAPQTQYGALTSPISGQTISGGGSSGTQGLPAAAQSALSQLPSDGQNAVKSYAQQVQSGSMTRADAESRLSAYGQMGTNALNALLGSSFNTNASNASAGTTAQGQQIQTAAQSTNAALDTLASAFLNLNPLQTAGIPATNSVANWIGQQFGDAALQKFRTNLADARSQLIGVLNSSGGTPTGNEATAYQYLPDNMTKTQFDQNVGTQQNPGIVRQLVAQKVGAFTQSGQQQSSGGGAGGTPMFGSFNGQ